MIRAFPYSQHSLFEPYLITFSHQDCFHTAHSHNRLKTLQQFNHLSQSADTVWMEIENEFDLIWLEAVHKQQIKY